MKRYVIIGNGTAAIGCIEGIRSVDKDGEITVISAEERAVYSRPLISYLLEGKTDVERMKYRPDDFYKKNGCRVIYGRRAVSLDSEKKTVALDDETVLPYEEICVAAGSRPFVPPFEGLDKVKNKFSFMTLDDALALEKSLSNDARVLIVGAGLIGLKCAEGIKDRVGSITVCDLADRVLSSILDADCAAIVQSHLEENGLEFMLGDTAVRFEENEAYMKSGKTVDFDILVLAVGVRANTEIIKIAGGEPRYRNQRQRRDKYKKRLLRRRLRRGLRRIARLKPRSRYFAERLYAGLYRRCQYVGRQRRVRQRYSHELHRIFRVARNDGGHVRRRYDRGKN